MIITIDRELIFDPPPASGEKPSLFYAAKMGVAAIDVSSRFLLDVSLKGASIALTDLHIKKFWQRLLGASHTILEAVSRSRIDINQSYVYMSNHISLLDIPVLFGAVPQSLRMVAKEELFHIPIFGHALEKAGFIPVDRSNPKKAISQLETAKHRLQKGVSVWIAPEGTRSRSLELAPLKKGGFYIAIALGVPIVPLWIEGTANVIHPDSLMLRPNQRVRVYFGKPIPTSGLQKENINNLMAQVRHELLALRPDLGKIALP